MNNYTNSCVELFKARDFDVLTDHHGKEFKKQKQALKILTDNTTKSFLYGGGASGAKSITGALWLVLSCLAYPDTSYFVARKTLKSLKKSFLKSFKEACQLIGLESHEYNINFVDSVIKFPNESEIHLLEVKHKPTDPEYEELGSALFTAGFCEEAGQIGWKAYSILLSRVGRWNNQKYGLLGKIFVTANPTQNWLYSFFYKPSVNKTLAKGVRFLKALAKDNPYANPDYIEGLKNHPDKLTYERLYLGNWDYIQDATQLLPTLKISDIFTNTHIKPTGDKKIICDVARYGSDLAVIMYFDGFVLLDRITHEISSIPQIVESINHFKEVYQVGNSKILVDADGVGGGVCDAFPGCVEFMNGSTRELIDDNYQNLKTECAYMLPLFIDKIYIAIELGQEEKDRIIEELKTLKTHLADRDGKLRILPKEQMKELLRRSPDYLDCFIMLMYFNRQTGFTFVGRT